MNFKIVLKNPKSPDHAKPEQSFAPTLQQAIHGAKLNLAGKPEGTYAKIFERVDVFVQDVSQDEK